MILEHPSPSQAPSTGEPETSSTCSAKKDVWPSMIYSLLPAALQNRIPALPSLRRSLGDFRGRAVYTKSTIALGEAGRATSESPPPSYRSTAGVEVYRTSAASSDTEEIDYRDDVPEHLTSSTPHPSIFPESRTGINWKYANQGISLLTQACQESNSLNRRDHDGTSLILTRQLYMHGMTYMLRGLPAELSNEETLSIQAAVPHHIISIQNDPDAHALVKVNGGIMVSQPDPPPDASILHRVTATVVFRTFVMIQFLLPYIKLFIGHAYRLERKHKITQRVVNKSITTVDELGRRSLQLSQTVCQMNDGKVGQAINDLTFWWVRGLTGGIQQGIAEGVVMFGNERPATPNGRVERLD